MKISVLSIDHDWVSCVGVGWVDVDSYPHHHANPTVNPVDTVHVDVEPVHWLGGATMTIVVSTILNYYHVDQ